MGTSLTETGLLEIETGAAAGRHAVESKKAKVKSKKTRSFIESILHKSKTLYKLNRVLLENKQFLYFLLFTFYFLLNEFLPVGNQRTFFRTLAGGKSRANKRRRHGRELCVRFVRQVLSGN
jgi:hypothetical protein